jgi:hypothetical protein
MDDRENGTSAYSVVVLGMLIVVACTLIAIWTLAEKLLSQ